MGKCFTLLGRSFSDGEYPGAPDMTFDLAPRISVIVIFYDMEREAKRTLHTLSPDYQIGVSEYDYEVIAIDNGSPKPLEEDFVKSFGSNFRFIEYDPGGPSPAMAVNVGIKYARAPYVAMIVDGARMVTPGIIRATLDALGDSKRNTLTGARPFISTLAWHLGPEVQNKSLLNGYNQKVENDLLKTVDWKHDGYSLFEVSTLANSSNMGFGGGFPTECSWFALGRSHFLEVGGYDRRFVYPGGGLVNHEFVERVFDVPPIDAIVLNGEGSFHQFHGGVATNVKPEHHPWKRFNLEYEQIMGRPYGGAPSPDTRYWGKVHAKAQRFKSDEISRQPTFDLLKEAV